jgi:hypothetical protein
MEVFLTFLEAVNVLLLVGLWRRSASLVRKLLWTPVVLLPVLGPFLYVGMFEAPKRYRNAALVHTNRIAERQ